MNVGDSVDGSVKLNYAIFSRDRFDSGSIEHGVDWFREQPSHQQFAEDSDPIID